VRKFETILRALKLRNIDVPLRHAANSAGLLSVPDSFLDMVRPGILAYGFYPTREVPRSVEVEGILSFKTRVVQLRDLPPGRNVSYGRTFTTKRWTRIGVLPVGYGHGYPWQLSNRGEVLIRGRRAPIVGRVTMDLTMVDATDIEVALGDEVVLWGEQQGARLGLDEVGGVGADDSLRSPLQHGEARGARVRGRGARAQGVDVDRRAAGSRRGGIRLDGRTEAPAQGAVQDPRRIGTVGLDQGGTTGI
jgi:hypothetical protein